VEYFEPTLRVRLWIIVAGVMASGKVRPRQVGFEKLLQKGGGKVRRVKRCHNLTALSQ